MSTRPQSDIVRTKLRLRLQNPIVLVLQGFVLGAILSVTLHPFAEALPAPPPSTDEMQLSAQA